MQHGCQRGRGGSWIVRVGGGGWQPHKAPRSEPAGDHLLKLKPGDLVVAVAVELCEDGPRLPPDKAKDPRQLVVCVQLGLQLTLGERAGAIGVDRLEDRLQILQKLNVGVGGHIIQSAISSRSACELACELSCTRCDAVSITSPVCKGSSCAGAGASAVAKKSRAKAKTSTGCSTSAAEMNPATAAPPPGAREGSLGAHF
eukprot:CAMPEP_0181257346 /NCGR_PEP_ID=MMETSP1096-20121128/50196_1 /TAXON_ID=156174 ORGANISM="Chrysochromulina ericina, Strain CCMP281" /NCGR_SAMPLE_ID=MMETSP1096 /ASSEMBLY_ACC=CAM_ASM_000453 /LENGTH=199 /DNA_ID=CAMNT_0023355659 /DNA_START=441 /DNA_END=1042 /DNA_ORIENTATION=+